MAKSPGVELSSRGLPGEAVDRLRGRAKPRPLTVLVVGTDDWASDQSAVALEAAGHLVRTCHEPGEAAFPCNALIEGRICPLDVGFNVVLTARARPSTAPAPGEMGVICALHAGAPLVSAGVSGKNPFEAWTAGVVGVNGDVVQACEKAAATHVFDLRERKP